MYGGEILKYATYNICEVIAVLSINYFITKIIFNNKN